MSDDLERRHTGPAAPSGPKGGAFGRPAEGEGPDQEGLMERLEAREGEDRGSGSLGQGIHVGTPAGGMTPETAERGSEHWGSLRTESEEEE